MSLRRVTSQMHQFDHLQCKRCNTVLPAYAVFCGKCGMRVDKDEAHKSGASLSSPNDIAARYRITSLVRRRPPIQLSFAFDTQLQRLIVLRDIDISRLDKATRELAYAELQQEYDLLRRQHTTDVTPLIASHNYGGHLYSVAGWPFPLDEKASIRSSISVRRPYTLHDLLQSGIGLPNEQTASSWIGALALIVERLHERQIIVGELDPHTIIVSSHDYSGQPALMVSWIPPMVRHILPQIPNTSYSSSFQTPQTLYGREDELTDIYCLGALLYLLLTGTTPDPIGLPNPKRYPLPSPRNLNPHISSALDAIVMQALGWAPDKRFQSARELGEALLDLARRPHIMHTPPITFAPPPKSTPKPLEEMDVSSDMGNNKSTISKEAQALEESNDETIKTRDILAQLAQRYLSKIKTGPLNSHEKQTGEATVDEIQIQEQLTEDVAVNDHVSDQKSDETLINKGKKIKKDKKRSNRKSQSVNGHIPEDAGNAEVQDETAQAATPSAQVVEVSDEPSNKVPLQDAAIVDTPTQEILLVASSESIAEAQTPSELTESELSIEPAAPQDATLNGEQPQDTSASETTQQDTAGVDAPTQEALPVAPSESTVEVQPPHLELTEAVLSIEPAAPQDATLNGEQPQDTSASETTQQELIEPDLEIIEQHTVAEPDLESTELQIAAEPDQEIAEPQIVAEPDQESTELQIAAEPDQEVPELHTPAQPDQDTTELQIVAEPDQEVPELHTLAEPELESTELQTATEPDQDTTEQRIVAEPDQEVPELHTPAQPDQDTTEQHTVAEPDQEVPALHTAQDATEQHTVTEPDLEITQQQILSEPDLEIARQLTAAEPDQQATQPQIVAEPDLEITQLLAVAESDQEVTQPQRPVEPDQEVTLPQELMQPDQGVTQQEEEHQPDVSQEEQTVPISQALVPQTTPRQGMLSAFLAGKSKERGLARIKDLVIGIRSSLRPTGINTNKDVSFLQSVQRFILGEQKHTTMAAALIETPMRIQPTQNYAIRIQIIGRDQLKDDARREGLSALTCGDIVHIEVRLALYQNYAYMVQQADVAIPASGYAAEVTVPMHPLSSGSSSRRERLHILFMDKERNPLYEKPFVIELFVSPLVQLGHEGHNVLSIPV